MSSVMPLMRIPVGVILERRRTTSLWTDVVWRPTAILGGLPGAEPWTVLGSDTETTTYFAGVADIELYRTETDNYRSNLTSAAPSVWVALNPTGGEPPYEIAAVTADPAEGEALTEPGQAIVEAVAMPMSVQEAIVSFIMEHHVERAFVKRKRDVADPDVLERHRPILGKRS
jgi:hypothetical protein